MKKIFDEVNSLDSKCYEKYFLNEDILMEHASDGIKQYIYKKFKKKSKVLIVCGSGNNGADGITLARLLHKDYDVDVYIYKKPKTKIGQIQMQRALALGVQFVDGLSDGYDVIVDALFGSGLNGAIGKEVSEIITILNNMNGFKIACDISSGIESDGNISSVAFKADITFTMGALKKSLFLDMTKDYVGKIKVIDLGVSRKLYEDESDCYLLEKKDLQLPKRDKKNTHKGRFGHLAIISGEKEGASILTALAGFTLGSGLVSLVTHNKIQTKPYIMQSHFIPNNTTAIALGMGLGKYDKGEMRTILSNDIAKVIDADMFYENDILEVLSKTNIVLTPHPKEFVSLLKLTNLADISIDELQKKRFFYVELFCKKYPNVVLLLKGANVLIAQDEKMYINSLGDARLSFGGSGDVLAGFIASLLAQGYCALEATIQGSLIHVLSSKKIKVNDYALTPFDLIKGCKKL